MWNLHRTTDIPRVHEHYFWQNLICRGYTGSKLSNNIECEIFQVLLEEARESYKEDIVMPLRSDNVEDISRNVGTLTDWVNNWRPSWWASWPGTYMLDRMLCVLICIVLTKWVFSLTYVCLMSEIVRIQFWMCKLLVWNFHRDPFRQFDYILPKA